MWIDFCIILHLYIFGEVRRQLFWTKAYDKGLQMPIIQCEIFVKWQKHFTKPCSYIANIISIYIDGNEVMHSKFKRDGTSAKSITKYCLLQKQNIFQESIHCHLSSFKVPLEKCQNHDHETAGDKKFAILREIKPPRNSGT